MTRASPGDRSGAGAEEKVLVLMRDGSEKLRMQMLSRQAPLSVSQERPLTDLEKLMH